MVRRYLCHSFRRLYLCIRPCEADAFRLLSKSFLAECYRSLVLRVLERRHLADRTALQSWRQRGRFLADQSRPSDLLKLLRLLHIHLLWYVFLLHFEGFRGTLTLEVGR